MAGKRKKYGFLYRIYRRMRYLNYVRRQNKLRHRADKARFREEKNERERIIREQRKTDIRSDREKKKRERAEILSQREMLESQQQLHAEDILQEEERRKSMLSETRLRRRRHRKRLLALYRRSAVSGIARSIAYLNPLRLPDAFGYLVKNRRKTAAQAVIATHSTLIFVASYLLVFMITQLSSSLSGLFYDYESVMFHNQLLWLVKPAQWFSDSVKMVYASGPVVILVISVFLVVIFANIRTGHGLLKLFILWTFLHGFTAFFGALLVGSLMGRGMGYAIIWSYVSDTSKVIYSIVSLNALLLMGIFTARSFMLSANSYYASLERKARASFLWAQLIIPFFMGNALILLLMSPGYQAYNTAVSLCLGIALLAVIVRYRSVPDLYFTEEDVKIRFRPGMLLASAAIILLYRIIFGLGIPVG